MRNELDATLEIAKMIGDLDRDKEGKLTPKSHGILQQRFKEKLVELRAASKVETDKDEILKAIDKAKLSILRGMHSKDKTARLLVDLVEMVNLICNGMEFRCHECCGDTHLVRCADVIEMGHPECPTCDNPMSLISAPDDIMRTDAHKAANAYVLRINQIKDSKRKVKKREKRRIPHTVT